MRRGELAARLGCHIETLRHYEAAGLLPPPPRLANGYRDYSTEHFARGRFVLRARELGFSLEEVRSLLQLADGKGGSCAEVKKTIGAHLGALKSRIADLRRMEQVLTATHGRCHGRRAPDCPLIERLSASE